MWYIFWKKKHSFISNYKLTYIWKTVWIRMEVVFFFEMKQDCDVLQIWEETLLLIQKIISTNINTHYKKWLSNFLTGRHAYTVHKGTLSTTRCFPIGVPQGSVLSPTLYNVFMHDVPVPARPDVCTHTLRCRRHQNLLPTPELTHRLH